MISNDVISKLKYIGLDLNNIPEFIKEKEKNKYQIQKIKDEKNYRVYKYIDINDIDILLTPANRFSDITERYEKAAPLCDYLDEQNLEKFTKFLKLLSQITIEDIEELDNLQKKLSNNIPLRIKFEKDYLWQIYYSEYEDKYFMLAPINETEFSEVFYVLKKQLEHKDAKIFVPICYQDFSNKFLESQKIQELENSLWLFTNNWPQTYEVYNKENVSKLVITGKAGLLETIESDYKITFENRENAEEFYNLVKALFILQTQCFHYYNFQIKILDDASISFVSNGEIVNTNTFLDFIKNEYISHNVAISTLRKTKIELESVLKNLKLKTVFLQQDFIEKEKQISTFLECKKTFIGRIRYFLKYKKSKLIINKRAYAKKNENAIAIEQSDKEKLLEKSMYTLQDLLEITKELDETTTFVNNLKLDIEGIERKNKLLSKKIENANLYIKEIDKHRKSIFDFWRFTSKDEENKLTEPLEKEEKKIKKVFNLKFDLDDIKINLDKKSRKTLSKEEQDKVFIATTSILEDINCILNDKTISEENLIALKNAVRNSKFDILTGADLSSNTLFLHRETEKNKFSILDINEETTLEEYKKTLRDVLKIINRSMEKIATDCEFSVYLLSKGELKKEFSIFSLDPQELIENIKEGEANLYQIIIPENTNVLPLTNIIYFNNLNQTLPLGMDKGTNILLNLKNVKLKSLGEVENNIITFNGNEMQILKIELKKYEVI